MIYNTVELIKPVLWRARLPGALAMVLYDGSLDGYGLVRDEYLAILVKAIGAVLSNEYEMTRIAEAISTERLADARRLSDVEAGKIGQSFFDAGQLYLALPLLQRGAKVGTPDAWVNLGAAYQAASAPRLAEGALREALGKDPNYGPAQMRLGTLLFTQRRYKEAERAFEAAGRFPGARLKYAETLYLLGDRTRARVVAEEILKSGERSPTLAQLLVNLDVADSKFGSAISRLTESFDGSTETYVPTLRTIVNAAWTAGELDAVEKALQLLILSAPTKDNYLLFGRALMARALDRGFESHAENAANMFQKALGATAIEVVDNPQLKLVLLELAEALIIAGDNQGANAAASAFMAADAKDDADANPSTRPYVPVARLLIVASGHLGGTMTEPALQVIEREIPKPLPFPELSYVLASRSGVPERKVPLSRWEFNTFDRFVCTRLPAPDRDIILATSRFVQRRVSSIGQTVTDGCPKPRD